MMGEERPLEPLISKESTQRPPLASPVAAGPRVVKVSKSKRTAQTSSAHFLTVYVKAVVSVYAEGKLGF